MTVKEMFEELELFRKDMDDGTIRYADDICYTTIWFVSKNNITINCLKTNEIDRTYFMKLYEAINKQIEELGWDD